MAKSILTVGSAVRDVFLLSKAFKVMPDPQRPGIMNECVTLGDKIDVDELVFATGGGGTNTATTFARLGFETAVFTRIGHDEPGNAILAELEKEHIRHDAVVVAKEEQTGYSTLLTASNGERTILTFRGASANFVDKEFKAKYINTDAVYLSSLAGNLGLAGTIAKLAQQKGAQLFWNPGKKELQSGHGLSAIRKLTSVFLVNLEEAQMVTKNTKRDAKLQCELLALPNTTVVITDGPNGAYLHHNGVTIHCRTSGATSVSRTGAGDAFGSGLAAALLHGMAHEDALRVATMNAESVVQKVGAKSGILKAWPTQNALAPFRVRRV